MRNDIKVGDRVYLIFQDKWGRVRELHPENFDEGGFYIDVRGQLWSVPADNVYTVDQHRIETARQKRLKRFEAKKSA